MVLFYDILCKVSIVVIFECNNVMRRIVEDG